MKEFLKLLRYGFFGIGVLMALWSIAVGAWSGWAASQIARDPEVEGSLSYLVTDERGKQHERVISIIPEQGAFPSDDLLLILRQGGLQAHLDIATAGGFQLLQMDFALAAPTKQIYKAALLVLASRGIGSVVEEGLGDIAEMTVRQALESFPEGIQYVQDLLGETYEDVLTELSGGNLDLTLAELFENPLDALQRLSPETLQSVADTVLGDMADRSLADLLDEPVDWLQDVLGENYEAALSDFFAGDPDKTIADAFQEFIQEPEEVLDRSWEVLGAIASRLLSGE